MDEFIPRTGSALEALEDEIIARVQSHSEFYITVRYIQGHFEDTVVDVRHNYTPADILVCLGRTPEYYNLLCGGNVLTGTLDEEGIESGATLDAEFRSIHFSSDAPPSKSDIRKLKSKAKKDITNADLQMEVEICQEYNDAYATNGYSDVFKSFDEYISQLGTFNRDVQGMMVQEKSKNGHEGHTGIVLLKDTSDRMVLNHAVRSPLSL